jgi:acyl-CoA thioesterase FadM
MTLHEDYVVTVRTRRVGTTSVVQDYGVFAPDLRATGSAVTVFTRDGVKVPVPADVRTALLALDP